MSISFGPFITCFFAIMFLTIYLYIVLYHAGSIFQKNTKWLFFGILLIFIRLSIPVNFPFTVSIYSRKLLPRFTNPFCDHRIGPLKIYQWLLIVWIAVAVMKTVVFFYRKLRLHRYLKNFIPDCESNDPVYRTLREYMPAKVQIAMVPVSVSPAIAGTLRPILVFPENIHFSDGELRLICMHEGKHYHNHDLWMKLLIELIVCLHWWNPFVYLLQKEYYLTLEIDNDNYLKNHSGDFDTIRYSELILKIAKKIQKGTSDSVTLVDSIQFTGTADSDLETRISFLLSGQNKKASHVSVPTIIHILVLCVAIMSSAFVVIEPSSPPPAEDSSDSFSLTDDNVAILEDSDGYQLYVNGKYVGPLQKIPDEFKDVKIYTDKKEIPHE